MERALLAGVALINVQKNDALTSLAGLNALTSFDGGIAVSGNAALATPERPQKVTTS